MYINMKSLGKIKPLRFDWNKGNKLKNWKKHKVDFRECEEVFFNEPLKTYQDVKHSQTENRYVALGISNEQRKLFLVFTIRNKKIRIISARDQNRKDRRIYEK